MPDLIPAEPLSPEWHAARRQGVTATDIVSILGIGYKSAYWLYWNKLGQVPDEPDSDRYRLGRYLEHYAVHRWLHDNPGWWALPGCGLFRSTHRAWQMATPDELVAYKSGDVRASQRQPDAVLECKTWADADRHAWADAPPPKVRAQVLWQMDVMDVPVGHVGVVFLPSGEFRSYVIGHVDMAGHFDQDEAHRGFECETCHDQQFMRQRGQEFYRRLQGELPPPDIDASAASLAAVKARFGDARKDKTVQVDAGLWGQYSDSKAMSERYAADARGWENQIREQIGEATVLEVDGKAVTRRRVYDSPVKAHTRHVDGFWRIEQQGDDSE